MKGKKNYIESVSKFMNYPLLFNGNFNFIMFLILHFYARFFFRIKCELVASYVGCGAAYANKTNN